MSGANKPLFTEHLTMVETLAPVIGTAMGQAHFAGTGPKGRTCRECAHWQIRNAKGEKVAYQYKGNGTPKVLEILSAHCTYPIANKANNRVPHGAASYRLFKPADSPPPATRRDRRYGKRGAS